MSATHRVILDTDIGTDVDDLLALALILGLPALDLIGVTTVYGDTRLRAQLTRRILTTIGRDVPVHAGESTPLSGREVWWAGHEGMLHTRLEDESYASDEAVQFLVDTVLAQPGQIDLIAIGPLTNIAQAIRADPEFASALRHLWVMGGSFNDGEAEHNFRSDAVAADIVFSAGIPTTVTGLEITRRIRIGASELARVASAGVLGRVVEAEIEQWWKFWDAVWNVPHDPVTVLTLTQPELFRFSEPGTITVDQRIDVGVSRFLAGRGRTRVTTWIDAELTSAAIVDGIIVAAATSVSGTRP